MVFTDTDYQCESRTTEKKENIINNSVDLLLVHNIKVLKWRKVSHLPPLPVINILS